MTADAAKPELETLLVEQLVDYWAAAAEYEEFAP